MKLFITGVSGYIGGSFLTKDLKLGYQVLCFDNFSNSNIEPIDKLRQEYKFKFYQTDLKDYSQISGLMKDFCPDVVVHFAALNVIKNQVGNEVINLGSNSGVSVFELVDVFNKVAKTKLPTKIAPRRISDLAVSYANTIKSTKILKWQTKKTLHEMCKSYLEFYENR